MKYGVSDMEDEKIDVAEDLTIEQVNELLKGSKDLTHEQLNKLLRRMYENDSGIEPKPCPFCKLEGFGMTGLYFTDPRRCALTCDQCEAEGPWAGPSDDGVEAINLWNRRKVW